MVLNIFKHLKLYYHFFKAIWWKKIGKSFRFPASIKLIYPVQKYQHVIESYVCILKTFVGLDKEQSVNALISFGIYSNPKLSK